MRGSSLNERNTNNDSSTSYLIEEVLEYVKYSKSDALLIAQKTDWGLHAERRTTAYYTSESRSEIDPEPVAFQDEIVLKTSIRRGHQEEILSSSALSRIMAISWPIVVLQVVAGASWPRPSSVQSSWFTGSAKHNATRKLYPCYSFGTKLGSAIFKKTIGPGPAHAIDSTITNKGKDGTPHYSLSSRHKELVPFNNPGPGTYGPEKKPTCFQGEKQSPAYSIGGRSKYRRRSATPSPNTCTLPSLLGPRIPNRPSSACYSMAGRQKLGGFDADYAKTPGPAGYPVMSPDNYQKKAPAYSMLSRQFMPGDTTQKPGPGAHSPEKVKMTKHSPPAYSMGIRHSEYLCPLIIEVAD